jgi:hypothetical protein
MQLIILFFKVSYKKKTKLKLRILICSKKKNDPRGQCFDRLRGLVLGVVITRIQRKGKNTRKVIARIQR